jgi:hypothetical protein
MEINKFFNPKRFCCLVYNDLLMHFKAYILYTLGIGAFMYIILTWAMHNSLQFQTHDYTSFLVIFVVTLFTIIGNAFPDFNNKITTSNYMLLPASTLEKFLSQFLIRVVVMTALFFAIFHLAAWLARSSFSPEERIKAGKQMIEEFSFSAIFVKESLRTKIALLFTLFSYMSFSFSARLFFQKYAVIKTLFAGILLTGGFAGAMILFSIIFYPNEIFFSQNIIVFHGYKVCESLENIQLYANCVAYISWIFFLTTGYFKLKEKQV